MSASPGKPISRMAYVALGSNLGDSRHTLVAAAAALLGWSERPMRRSGLWRSTPMDCPPDSPDFLNAVVELTPRSTETPESFLERLLALEVHFGRQPKHVHNEARPLDLDLIAFGQEQCATPRLVLPHPRAALRGFVLAPLAELAPGLILPGQDRTVAELWRRCPVDEGLHRVGDFD